MLMMSLSYPVLATMNKAGIGVKQAILMSHSLSDIDWTKSITEIVRQLYAKYSLDEQEIAFIEQKIEAME